MQRYSGLTTALRASRRWQVWIRMEQRQRRMGMMGRVPLIL
jgi:hypothetical protein